MIEQLYRTYGHIVLRRARRMLGSDNEARDVLHELFVGLLADPTPVTHVRSHLAWIYAATTHLCLNSLRNRRTRLRLLQTSPTSDNPLGLATDAMAILRERLAQLPAELGEVVVYYYADEMTHAEIAEVMGCSRRHVGSLLRRAEQYVSRLERFK